MRSLFSATALLAFVGVVAGSPHDVSHGKRHHGFGSPHGENFALGKRAEYNNVRFTFYWSEMTACGRVFSDSEHIVALSIQKFKPSMCNQQVTLTYKGVTQTATILDSCVECPVNALDCSAGLFEALTGSNWHDIGTVYTGNWSFGGSGGGGDKEKEEEEKTTTKKATTTTQPKPTTKTTHSSTKTTESTTKTTELSTSKKSSSSSVAPSTSSESFSSVASTASSTAASTPTTALPTPQGALDQMAYVLIGMAGMVVNAQSQTADLF